MTNPRPVTDAMLARAREDALRVEAAAKIRGRVNAVIGLVSFLAGVTVAAWIAGDVPITLPYLWTAAAAFIVLYVVQIGVIRYRLDKSVQTLSEHSGDM